MSFFCFYCVVGDGECEVAETSQAYAAAALKYL